MVYLMPKRGRSVPQVRAANTPKPRVAPPVAQSAPLPAPVTRLRDRPQPYPPHERPNGIPGAPGSQEILPPRRLGTRPKSIARHRRAVGHQEGQRRLWSLSDRLPKLDDKFRFDGNKRYRVRLSRTVEVPGTEHFLRPSDDVVVSGSVAQSIRQHIAGAKVV